MRVYELLDNIVRKQAVNPEELESDRDLINRHLEGELDLNVLPKRLQDAVIEWENWGTDGDHDIRELEF